MLLCDNIGLMLACLLSGSTDVTASASLYMTQPSGIPILSPVLFMHVGNYKGMFLLYSLTRVPHSIRGLPYIDEGYICFLLLLSE